MAFPESVDLAHRAVQVEDQLVPGAAPASAINPLARHVHQGHQVLAGGQNPRLEPAHLPGGRRVSLVDAGSLSFALPAHNSVHRGVDARTLGRENFA